MKALFLVIAAAIVLTGCGSKKLSKDEALALLKKEYKFPRTIERYIFCRDVGHARMIMNSGLEEQGWVTVKRTVKMFEEGVVPIIFFTDKAKPYLLPYASKEDEKDYIRPVKLADENVVAIISIITDGDNKTATVTYSTRFENLTPFHILSKTKLKGPQNEKTATFALSDEGKWILQKQRF